MDDRANNIYEIEPIVPPFSAIYVISLDNFELLLAGAITIRESLKLEPLESQKFMLRKQKND